MNLADGCQKRVPGCHGSCEEYKQDRANYDAMKVQSDKQKAIIGDLISQRDDMVAIACKRRRGHRG